MTKIPAVKEHPYSSHISRFAMFPSFCSPDDPERGVRAAGQPFPNHRVPSRAPDVTLLSKAIGRMVGGMFLKRCKVFFHAQRTKINKTAQNMQIHDCCAHILQMVGYFVVFYPKFHQEMFVYMLVIIQLFKGYL